MICKVLGDNLKKYAHDNNLTQAQMAEKIGVSRGFYQMLERGDKSPSMDTLESIFEKLGISPDDLLIDSRQKRPVNLNQALAEISSIIEMVNMIGISNLRRLVNPGANDEPAFLAKAILTRDLSHVRKIGQEILNKYQVLLK